MQRRVLSMWFVLFFVFIFIVLFFEALDPIKAHAIPAFTRKYNADCSMCHYPNAPRLNSFGHEFRRAGFRTPDEFNKDQDISKVGDFLAARTRVRYEYENIENDPARSEFVLNDTTIFYSGALTKYFSAFNELERERGGELELVASISGVYGQPDHFYR